MWVWLLLARAHDTFYALYRPHFFLLLYGKQERLFSTSGMQRYPYKKKAYERTGKKSSSERHMFASAVSERALGPFP